MRELDTYNRFRDSFKARANEDDGQAPEKEGPVSPNVQLLRRVERIIFSPNVKTLEEAASRLRTLLDELDDDEKQTKKPDDK